VGGMRSRFIVYEKCRSLRRGQIAPWVPEEENKRVVRTAYSHGGAVRGRAEGGSGQT
jgi:hypothetical protein